MELNPNTIYVMDTSSLIEAMERHYPILWFPDLWNEFDKKLKVKSLIILKPVFDEAILMQGDTSKNVGALSAWLNTREKYITQVDQETQNEFESIRDQYYEDTKNYANGYDQADPYLIAYAKVLNRESEQEAIVISEENFGTTSQKDESTTSKDRGNRPPKLPKTPKIPFICHKEEIKCVKIVRWIDNYRMRFILDSQSPYFSGL